MHAVAHGIVETVRHPCVALDERCRVAAVNESFLQAFGESAIEGRGFFEIDAGRWNVPSLRELLLSPDGEATDAPLQIADIAGQLRVRVRRLPLAAPQGSLILLGIDFESPPLQPGADALTAMQANEHHAIICQTLEGIVTGWNVGAERLYGYRADEAIGRDLTLIIPPDQMRQLADLRQRIRRGESVPPFDTVRLHRDGHRLDVKIGLSPIRDARGQVIGVFGIGTDIAARKHAERERNALNVDLRERVKELRVLHKVSSLLQDDSRATEEWLAEIAELLPSGWQYPEITAARIAWGPIAAASPGYIESPWRQSVNFTAGGQAGTIDIIYHEERPAAAEGPFLTEERHLLSSLAELLRAQLERRQAVETLRRGESRYRALIETIPALMWVYSGDGRPILHNQRWHEYTGQTIDDTLADRWHEAVHPDDVPGAIAHWNDCKATGQPFRFEYRLRGRDGVYRWYLSQGVPLRGAHGIEQWVGICIDIDDRKRAADELRRTTDLLAAISDGSADAMYVKDLQGRYLLFNPAAARFVGRPVAEVLGHDDTELFDPASARLIQERDRLVLKTGETYIDEEVLTAAGITRTYLVMKAPYRDANGAIIGVIGISRDITDRKLAEESLRDKEAKLAEAVRLARMGYWSRDLATGAVEWSEELFDIFGVEPSTFGHTLDSFLACVHPDELDEVRRRIESGVSARATFDHSYRIVVRGEVKYIYERGQVHVDDAGTPIRVAGTAQDVTERARALEDLRLRDRAISAATQGLVLTDAIHPENPIVYASPGFERITGYSEAEVLGRNCRFLQGPDSDRSAVAQLRAAVEAGEACSVELLNYHKDGSPFWNELSISPVHDDRGRLTHFVGVMADVSVRHRLEQQFRQAQKMEAVGRLAGGIAHDFNNLLTIINGYTDLLLRMVRPDEPMREMLVEIQAAGERSAGLTRQLLAFSRQQMLAPRIIDLNVVVAEVQKLLSRLIGEDVELGLRLQSDLPAVQADPGQIEQVLLNLAVNARDAMPTGGRITIETRCVDLDAAYVALHPEARIGPHVALSVADTGTGMSPEVKRHIFEPFFTTKELGKGTGLGLATVYGIVKQSGGHLSVYSEVGLGSTFTIYLPCTTRTADSPRNSAAPATPPRGDETVLLVEDEESVQRLAAHVLMECGYHVMVASDGEKALQLAWNHDGPLHLLVTDVVMPGMGGRAVAEQILKRFPDARVLFVSGYTDDTVLHRGLLQEDVNFLQKPFSPLALAQKVRELLDAPADSE